MFTDRSRALTRGFVSATLTLLAVALAQSCGFPDHAFVSDDEFYGKGGGKTGSGGSGGADASVSGAGGNGVGGVSNDGGAGGGTAGSPGTGGTGTIGKREAGAPRVDSGIGGAGVTDASPPNRDTGTPCGLGLTSCSDVCVDTLTDKNHCGNCTTVCTGTDVCSRDGCAPPCASGLSLCTPTGTSTGICVDTNLNENNCGACNKACAGGFVCEAGKCVIDCGALTRCGAQCADTATDDVHCGNCTTNCKTSGQVCSAGVCQANCSFPLIPCGAACVNSKTDGKNCNGCGNVCAAGKGCVAGVCTTLVEDCQNGSDDDQDLLIDCADPDCQAGFTCATTPAGWNGPVALWSGAAGTGPTCAASGGYPASFLAANAGLVAPSYTCPACTCSPDVGLACADFTVIFDTSTNCANTSPWTPGIDVAPTVGSACAQFIALCEASPTAKHPEWQTAQSIKLEKPPAAYATGTCTASQPTPQFPSTNWTTDVLGCGTAPNAAGGCSGAQCLPKPKAPFGSTLCVFRSGVSACPAGYPNQNPAAGQQFFQSVKEGRSCSACGCAPTCGGTFTTYTDNNCTAGTTATDVADIGCTRVPPDNTQLVDSSLCGDTLKIDTRSYKLTNTGPVCGKTPSTLNGAPSGDSPVTVCCQ